MQGIRGLRKLYLKKMFPKRALYRYVILSSSFQWWWLLVDISNKNTLKLCYISQDLFSGLWLCHFIDLYQPWSPPTSTYAVHSFYYLSPLVYLAPNKVDYGGWVNSSVNLKMTNCIITIVHLVFDFQLREIILIGKKFYGYSTKNAFHWWFIVFCSSNDGYHWFSKWGGGLTTPSSWAQMVEKKTLGQLSINFYWNLLHLLLRLKVFTKIMGSVLTTWITKMWAIHQQAIFLKVGWDKKTGMHHVIGTPWSEGVFLWPFWLLCGLSLNSHISRKS